MVSTPETVRAEFVEAWAQPAVFKFKTVGGSPTVLVLI
jgi:hypothetical protein